MNDSGEMIPTRQSLLSRLRDCSDNESWRDFFETYWRLIYRTGMKSGLTDDEAQDLVQETMVSVFKSMPTFEYRQEHGSFKVWLLRLTSWRIVDQLRKRDPGSHRASRRCEPGTGLETDMIERIVDPAASVEAGWDADWEENLMEAAIARVKNQVDPKAYQMFHLAVFKDWPVSRIAESLNVSAAQVYLAKHRITKRVKREARRLKIQPIRPPETLKIRTRL